MGDSALADSRSLMAAMWAYDGDSVDRIIARIGARGNVYDVLVALANAAIAFANMCGHEGLLLDDDGEPTHLGHYLDCMAMDFERARDDRQQ